MRLDFVRKIDRQEKLRARAEAKRARRLAKSAERKQQLQLEGKPK
jgi:hypothetical protein